MKQKYLSYNCYIANSFCYIKISPLWSLRKYRGSLYYPCAKFIGKMSCFKIAGYISLKGAKKFIIFNKCKSYYDETQQFISLHSGPVHYTAHPLLKSLYVEWQRLVHPPPYKKTIGPLRRIASRYWYEPYKITMILIFGN